MRSEKDGIGLLAKLEYNEIITKANPKMFIEPYQPNKLTTANEIYSEALKNKHNRDVLKKLLDRIKKEL